MAYQCVLLVWSLRQGSWKGGRVGEGGVPLELMGGTGGIWIEGGDHPPITNYGIQTTENVVAVSFLMSCQNFRDFGCINRPMQQHRRPVKRSGAKILGTS